MIDRSTTQIQQT